MDVTYIKRFEIVAPLPRLRLRLLQSHLSYTGNLCSVQAFAWFYSTTEHHGRITFLVDFIQTLSKMKGQLDLFLLR